MLPILKGMTKGSTRTSGRQNNFVLPVATMVLLFLIGQGFWLSRNTHLFTPFSVKRIDCDQCSKVGVVRDENDSRIMKMCPACFGVGYHSVRRFDDLDAICAACGGVGRLEADGVWRTCERCEGRGVHRNSEWKTIVGLVSVDTSALINIQPASAGPTAGETSNIQHSSTSAQPTADKTFNTQHSIEDEETTNGKDSSTPAPLNP